MEKLKKDSGFVLITTMMLLIVLTLVALTGVRTSRIELIISGNEKWHQDSFYRGEGAMDASTLLLEMQLLKADVKKRANNWGADAFYVNNIDFDMWRIDGKKGSKLINPDKPNEDARALSDDIIEPGGSLDVESNVIVVPKSAIDSTRKITGAPVSLVRIGLLDSTSTPGMDVGVASGADVPAGSTRSQYTIWTRSYGKVKSRTELEVQWFSLH